ncbi:hypothetical protein OROGR_026892 [Orobanche gracilis]
MTKSFMKPHHDAKLITEFQKDDAVHAETLENESSKLKIEVGMTVFGAALGAFIGSLSPSAMTSRTSESKPYETWIHGRMWRCHAWTVPCHISLPETHPGEGQPG